MMGWNGKWKHFNTFKCVCVCVCAPRVPSHLRVAVRQPCIPVWFRWNHSGLKCSKIQPAIMEERGAGIFLKRCVKCLATWVVYLKYSVFQLTVTVFRHNIEDVYVVLSPALCSPSLALRGVLGLSCHVVGCVVWCGAGVQFVVFRRWLDEWGGAEVVVPHNMWHTHTQICVKLTNSVVPWNRIRPVTWPGCIPVCVCVSTAGAQPEQSCIVVWQYRSIKSVRRGSRTGLIALGKHNTKGSSDEPVLAWVRVFVFCVCLCVCACVCVRTLSSVCEIQGEFELQKLK